MMGRPVSVPVLLSDGLELKMTLKVKTGTPWKERLKPKALVNYALWGLMVFLLSQRVPTWIANYKVEGQLVADFSARDAVGMSQILPRPGVKQIVVFWATWCKPCEVELSRFNSAVKNREIPARSVLAISVGEEPQVVFAEAKSRGYEFLVYADPTAASTQSLDVQGTPQIYHIGADKRVEYASMGLSPLSIFKAKRFLAVDSEFSSKNEKPADL